MNIWNIRKRRGASFRELSDIRKISTLVLVKGVLDSNFNIIFEVANLREHARNFSFTIKHSGLEEVLTDHNLASLGDAYINFVYSLALSNRKGKPLGVKVKGSVLAEAVKESGLREHLPSRMTRHMLADAAEALIVYAWLHKYITLEESVTILENNLQEGFRQLLTVIKKRIKFS